MLRSYKIMALESRLKNVSDKDKIRQIAVTPAL